MTNRIYNYNRAFLLPQCNPTLQREFSGLREDLLVGERNSERDTTLNKLLEADEINLVTDGGDNSQSSSFSSLLLPIIR